MNPNSEGDNEESWIEIPVDRLSSQALDALIEEFVTREGTDYGVQEVSVEQQVQRARASLHKGDVIIVFNLDTETTQLISRDDYRKLTASESAFSGHV